MTLQRHTAGRDEPSTVPPIVHTALNSPGRPLDGETRGYFEPRFGRDFSGVRVHTDAVAARSAEAVHASAYTVANDLVFAEGEYSPRTPAGRELLAHELTHVVQQAGVGSKESSAETITNPGDASEREAEATAESVLRGEGAPAASMQGGPQVARQASPPTAATAPGADTKSAAPAPAPAKPAPASTPRGPRDFQRRGYGFYTATLSPADKAGAPCQLDAVTRVKFNFDTSDPIPVARREPWAKELASLVSRHWTYRYLLVPEKPCAGEACSTIAVRVKVDPVTSGEQHNINVYNNKPTLGGTSSTDIPGSSPGTFYESDIRPGSPLSRQRVALHEGGHLFGVPHISCDSNSFWCYGLTAGSADDVMGSGEYVSARDYEPFVEAANELSSPCKWRTGGPGGEGRGRPEWMIGLGILGAGAGALAGAATGSVGGAIALGLLGGALGAFVGWMIDMSPGNVPTPGDTKATPRDKRKN